MKTGLVLSLFLCSLMTKNTLSVLSMIVFKVPEEEALLISTSAIAIAIAQQVHYYYVRLVVGVHII